MNVQKINSYQNQTTSFRATYPVAHWVSEDGKKYILADVDTIKKLQGKIVRMLNKKVELKDIQERALKAYIQKCDVDYRAIPTVRSFYNKETSGLNPLTHLVYLITGRNVKSFEDVFAKDIGRAKSGKYQNRQLYQDAALNYYNNAGLDYVNNPNLRIRDQKGIFYVLTTKFQIIRNKKGEIKDYKFVDAKFLPEKK